MRKPQEITLKDGRTLAEAITKTFTCTGVIIDGELPHVVDLQDCDDDLAAIAQVMDEEAGNDADAFTFPRWTVALHDQNGIRDITGACIQAYAEWDRARRGKTGSLSHPVPHWWADYASGLGNFYDVPEWHPEYEEAPSIKTHSTPCWGRPTGV